MAFFSFFKRQPAAPAGAVPAESAADLVQRARVRARRRLIGAVVLIGIGIIGFPLLFETYPRPIPVDIPIEIANKDTVPPLVMPPSRSASGAVGADAASAAGMGGTSSAGASAPAASQPARADSAAPASAAAPDAAASPTPGSGRTEAGSAQANVRAASPGGAATASRFTSPATDAASAPARSARAAAAASATVREPVARSGDTARATEPAASSGRFVVQVGAYSEASSARQARQRAEKLGLKTHTQVVATAGGERIRVRVGPFATREEADRAAGKLKSAGLPAALVAL